MGFDEYFEKATGGQLPYTYQRQLANAKHLPDLLHVPTGAGKTAAAVLAWLWHRREGSEQQRAGAGRRLIYCLPMRTLVEQTHLCVQGWRDVLGITQNELGVHLLMGGAVDHDWERHPERDAVIIGTQDHLLSRALLRGYGMSRYRWPMHFALLHSDCTWVIDEVQLMGVGASTAAQLQAFREDMGTYGPVHTLWMTATLDERRLRTVDVKRPFSRLPFDGTEPALRKRFEAQKDLAAAEAAVSKKGAQLLVREIAAQHIKGSLTLVIVNRVGRAQELRRLLAREPNVEDVELIHSRFRPGDRRRIQERALGGAFCGVLVATQALEAGVDVSARTLFTELAPWSSLVQRFGRLNRAGEHKAPGTARAFWFDIDTADAEMCLPYDADALVAARARLQELTDVGPASLEKFPLEACEPALPVLRRKDLLDLFDTEPDLAGHHIDISPYIRVANERDVQVAWRPIGDDPPLDEAPAVGRDELCAVPFHALQNLAKEHKMWRFDGSRAKGTWVRAKQLFPGLTVVVDVGVGGYSSEFGFTGAKSDVSVQPVEVCDSPEEHDAADPLCIAADYVPLEVHAEDTVQEMEQILPILSIPAHEHQLLIDAARWHDVGKVHGVFQRMLTKNLRPDDVRCTRGPWAKSDRQHSGRNERPFFRHELASALAWIDAGKPDLGAFLVAAHHGKVRISLRARPAEQGPPGKRFAHGIHDGDTLEAAKLGSGIVSQAMTLSLACMELGGGGVGWSWADRMLAVLEQYGPFRLALLETLVRVADWRASARHGVSAHGVKSDA